jgi:hypothetical protein
MRIGSIFFLLVLSSGVRAGDAAAPKYDWGVAYYLSYDNDLGRAGQIIARAVRAGVTSEKCVAAVQADLPGPGGMQRVSITSTGATQTRIASEDSASEDQAIAYLEWFVKTYPCRHYAFIFPDHGGRLDEMCLDLEPETDGKFWMSGKVLGEKLRELKKTLPGELELLFLQQCGRGSLENLYSFCGTANFIMSSPVPVGAPNSYYTAFHRWLPDHPDASGKELAEKIAAEDKDFTVYTCASAQKLADLPRHLDDALRVLLEKNELAAPELPVAIYSDSEESTRDQKTYLTRLVARNNAGEESLKDFEKWIAEELLTGVWFQKNVDPAKRSELSGLSIFVPVNAAEAVRYRELDLYTKSSLGKLWSKLLKN